MKHGFIKRVRIISSRMAVVWRRVRKPVIGCYVLAHFTFGLLCFLPHPCALWEVPGVEKVTQAYDVADLAQTWRMFAPPSQSQYEIGYSLKFKEGWTNMLFLESILEENGAGRVLLPRGYLRLSTHLRHPSLKQQPLDQQPFFFHYFQQLSAFFLFGDGRIPGVEAIRFYSVVKGIEPFFEKNADGKPSPKASDYDRVEPLYERTVEEQ